MEVHCRFLTEVQPAVALISVGASNRYGHPGLQTLNRLKSLGIPVFRTDRQGRLDLKLARPGILVNVSQEERTNAAFGVLKAGR